MILECNFYVQTCNIRHANTRLFLVFKINCISGRNISPGNNKCTIILLKDFANFDPNVHTTSSFFNFHFLVLCNAYLLLTFSHYNLNHAIIDNGNVAFNTITSLDYNLPLKIHVEIDICISIKYKLWDVSKTKVSFS